MSRAEREIWLCLHFRELALELFGARRQQRPLAVIEQQRIHASSVARLAPGLALATAYALCPTLLALARQPLQERETLQQLAHWAYQFTPAVSCADNNCLLLEIGGCRRLYRGITPLLETLRQALDEREHRVAMGLAHTRKAAWLLAQNDRAPALAQCAGQEALDRDALRQQLAAVPVAHLPVDAKIRAALAQMGIDTLAALLALPEPALGKRFGAAFVRYLQQLRGRHPDPQPVFVPAPAFRHGLAFGDGIHNRQMLQFPLKRLLQSLCDYLGARQLLCRALRWQLHDAQRPQAELCIELARAQNQWRNFYELTLLQLEQLPLRDAVYALTLTSTSFVAAAPGTGALFTDADAGDTEADTALLDRIQARLGRQALHRLGARAAHWPEAAWQSTELQELPATDIPPAGGPRPLWLLPQPLPLQQRNGRLHWQTPLELLRGPERIGNHWWREAEQQRDYYVARAGDGRLCWIFCELPKQRWFVHGLFG
jgi:protein ImuB